MQCDLCGQTFNMPARFCPNCGEPIHQAQPTANIQAMPAQQAVPQRPSANGQIGFSVISIVLGCASWGVSTILGLVAMIFAVVASSACDPGDAARKLRVAKTLNIIAVVVIGLAVLIWVLFIILQIVTVSSFTNFDTFDYYTY